MSVTENLRRVSLFSSISIIALCHATETLVLSQSRLESSSTIRGIHTVALETYARNSFNYYRRMVDKDGLPYFNIFWTEPVEAAHDWPDFGDVMSRQYQGAIMGRLMTGETVPTEAIWRRKILGLIDPASGLLTRPQTSFSQKVPDPGDQALTLYALVTAYADKPDVDLRDVITRMADALLARAERGGAENEGFFSGFIIKSLMACVRVLHYEPALQAARIQVRKVFESGRLFSPDNHFRHGGHVHGNLRTLVGAADYALYIGDPILYSRVDALYRYVRSESTRFGFMPEVIGRKGDVVATETCALMDFLGLAVTLANHGHPEYWADVERLVRNQLIESQASDLSWLQPLRDRPDTEQFTWRDIAQRMLGGYAGWSSPNHFLATRETLHWGGAELRGKTRVFQNCCGGSGTHAFFIAWKNSARFERDTLWVHLHLDKLLPEAEIRGYQPFKGLLTIRLKKAAAVRVRIPDFVNPSALVVESAGKRLTSRVFGNYVELDKQPAGQLLRINYPLPLTTEECEVGNPGFRHYRYRVTWKGDTVVRMEPLGDPPATGYSDFEKKDVPVYYGHAGPGLLYQRESWIADGAPELSPLRLDENKLDFWYGLSGQTESSQK